MEIHQEAGQIMIVTLQQLKKIMPNAGKRADVFLDHLNNAMQEFWINTANKVAMFLAQIAHESGELRYTAEIASGAAYSGRADLGNTRPEAIEAAKAAGMAVGPYFKGHGLIQITGYHNHKACGDALGVDAVRNPSVLERPEYAARCAGWFFHANGLLPVSERGDIRTATRIVNGGYNGLPSRLEYWARAKAVLA